MKKYLILLLCMHTIASYSGNFQKEKRIGLAQAISVGTSFNTETSFRHSDSDIDISKLNLEDKQEITVKSGSPEVVAMLKLYEKIIEKEGKEAVFKNLRNFDQDLNRKLQEDTLPEKEKNHIQHSLSLNEFAERHFFPKGTKRVPSARRIVFQGQLGKSQDSIDKDLKKTKNNIISLFVRTYL